MASSSGSEPQPEEKNTGLDERGPHLPDQPSEVGRRTDLGRRQGYELSSPDGERCAGMVWQSWKDLNRVFEMDGPDGVWTERYVTECKVPPPLSGNHFTPEGRESLRLARLGKRDGGNSKPVEWEGVQYASIQRLAEHMGVSRTAALMRLRRRDGTYVDKRPRKRDK